MVKRKPQTHILVILIGLALAVMMETTGVISNTLRLILEYIAIFSIFALGINLVNGYLGIFSLAHAGIMAVGGYASSLVSMYVLPSAAYFPVSLLIGGIASMLVGLLLAFPSFTVRGDYLAIITLGFSLLIQSLLQNIDAVGASRGLRPIPKYTNAIWVYLSLILAIIVVKRFVNSRYGRSMLAIRKDHIAAELSSVHVRRVKLVAFGVSAFLIGIAGGLLCHLLSYTNPNQYGYHLIIEGLLMVYVGGIGSITGSIIGAAIWQVLVQTLRFIGLWRWILGGAILVFFMIYKPNGIFGNQELTKDAIIGFFRSVKNFTTRWQRDA